MTELTTTSDGALERAVGAALAGATTRSGLDDAVVTALADAGPFSGARIVAFGDGPDDRTVLAESGEVRATGDAAPLAFARGEPHESGECLAVPIDGTTVLVVDGGGVGLEEVTHVASTVAGARAALPTVDCARPMADDLLSDSDIGALVINRSQSVVWMSHAVERYLGTAPADVVGESVDALLAGTADLVEDPERLVSAASDPERMEFDFTIEGPEGDRCHVRYRVHPIRSGPHAGGWVVLLYDITERRRAEEALEHERALVNDALDSLDDIFYVISEDGRFLRWNDRVTEVTGYDDEEIASLHPTDLIDGDHRERIEMAMSAGFTEGRATAEAHLQTKSGETVPYEFTGDRLDHGETTYLCGTARDVSDRRDRQTKLRALNEASRTLLRAESVEDVARVAIETTGDVLGCQLTGLWTYDEDRDRLDPVATTDGATDVFGEVPSFSPGDSLAWKTFESGTYRLYEDVRSHDGVHNPDTPVEREVMLPLGNHGLLVTGRTDDEPFDDDTVSLLRLFAATIEAALDSVHRKRLLCRREADLRRQNDRLEFLNSLLRHDILNGMMVITNYADFLGDHVDEEGERYLGTIREYGDDIVSLVEKVRAVLTAITDEDEPLGPVDLPSVVERQCRKIRAATPEATVTADVPPDVAVLANDLLADVVGNVVSNAVEHAGESPVIEVSVERRGEWVEVRVADDGPGIPPAHRDRVFERGFGSGEGPVGSGFGLYFVATMLDRYGGEVRVEASETGGAAVVLSLRAADADGDR